eukprot:gene14253-15740_t
MSKIRVSLGTMEFGRQLSREKSHAVIKKFLEYGHKEVDTALMYVNGESEKIIGDLSVCRDAGKIAIATKANPNKGFKHDDVINQLDTSLKSLQIEKADIFYLHWPDHKNSIEDTLRAVNQLYKDGKFVEFGLSNYRSWEVVEIYHICKANGWILPTVYQGMYNSLTRCVEEELLPALKKYGLRFYAYNPLAGGLLTDRYSYEDVEEKKPRGRFFEIGGKWSEIYRNRFWKQSYFNGIQMIREALTEQYGEGQVTTTEAALRWMVHHSGLESNDGIIVGASKMEHLESNLKALEKGPLHKDVVEAFQNAWTGIKGDCPSYYR